MLKKRLLKNQKGLSAIVSTLIIILLVLVAVGIIWVVVKNLVEEGAERIELGKFTLDLEIKAAQIQNGDVTVVVVRRNPGEGNYVGMNFIFSDGTNSEIIRENTTLQELEERSFTFTLTEITTANLETISVAPIFELSSGKESAGNVEDDFEVTEEMRAGITGGAVRNFEQMGLVGWGTAEYTVSSEGGLTLKITRVIVDPLDVHVGDIQTFIAYVTSPNNITEVITRTQLDNELLVLPLEKTENENEYMATWEVYDTHVTIYRTNFTARDSAGNEDMVTMSWTDACTSLADHGTTKTISSPCSVGVSGVDGIDVGNIIISGSGSVTINSGGNFIYTPGYSVSLSGGKILQGGGSLRKAYLYYNDDDGDLRGSGYDWSTSTTYALHTRANLATGDSDCNDNNDGLYQNIGSISFDNDQDGYTYVGSSPSTECVGGSSSISGRTYYWGSVSAYVWMIDSQKLGINDCNNDLATKWRNRYSDSDGDGHCPSSSQTCVGNDAGYVDSCTTYTDCCDTDSRAKPGQTAWYTSPRTGGCAATYDFNCVGGDQKESLPTGGKCWSCYWEIEGICGISDQGDDGWSGSSPACGAPGNYIFDPGESCTGRSGDEEACLDEDCYMGDQGPRTQACH